MEQVHHEAEIVLNFFISYNQIQLSGLAIKCGPKIIRLSTLYKPITKNVDDVVFQLTKYLHLRKMDI